MSKKNVDITYWGRLGLVLISGLAVFLFHQYRQWQSGLSNDKPNSTIEHL